MRILLISFAAIAIFDLTWFDDKAKIEMYLCFDWSKNCGDIFCRELVKFILTILKENILPAKL